MLCRFSFQLRSLRDRCSNPAAVIKTSKHFSAFDTISFVEDSYNLHRIGMSGQQLPHRRRLGVQRSCTTPSTIDKHDQLSSYTGKRSQHSHTGRWYCTPVLCLDYKLGARQEQNVLMTVKVSSFSLLGHLDRSSRASRECRDAQNF